MGIIKKIKALFLAESLTGGIGRIFARANDYNDQTLKEQASYSWAFIAIDAIAKEVGSVRLRLYKKAGAKDKEIEEHEALYKLNNPNSAQTDYDILWTTSALLNAVGEAVWIFDKGDFSVFSRESLDIKFDDYGRVKKVYLINTQTEFKGDDVIIFRKPSIDGPLVGRSITSAIARTIDLDTFLEEHLRAFFLNNATPQGFLSPDGKNRIAPEFVDRLITRLNNRHKGVGKSHKFGVLEVPMKWIQTGVSVSDQELEATSNLIRKKILAAYGVPEAVLGITDGVRANSDVANRIFAERAIKPNLVLIEKQLNKNFLPRFERNKGCFFKFDEVVKDDEKLKAEINQIYVNSGILTIDEAREELGYGPIQKEGEASKEATLLANFLERKVEKGAYKQMKTEFTNKEILDFHQKKLDFSNLEEMDLREDLILYFERQKNKIARSIKIKNIKTCLIEWDKIDQKEIDLLEKILIAHAIETIIFQSRNTNIFLGLDGVLSEKDTVVEKYLEDRPAKSAKSIIDNLQKRIDKVIAETDSVQEAKEKLDMLYNDEIIPNKTEEVSITETSAAAGFATLTVYKMLKNKPVGKQWKAIGDNKTCQYCGPMNGVVIPLEKKFWNANERMVGIDGGVLDFKFTKGVEVYPMHSRCRCSLIPIFDNDLIPDNWDDYKKDLKK